MRVSDLYGAASVAAGTVTTPANTGQAAQGSGRLPTAAFIALVVLLILIRVLWELSE